MANLISSLIGAGYDIFWTIIGNGTDKKSILEYCEEKGIIKNISLLDEMPQAQLKELYSSSNFYVQLSHNETFGISPMEAYAYQCKLIISDMIPSINELIEDNDNILKIKKEDFDNVNLTQVAAFLDAGFKMDLFSDNILSLKNEIYSSPFLYGQHV